MKAYAILDGGGVKGAALAGCLKAAEDLKVEFKGYGGTSAGAIVALLASIGFTGEELREVMTEELKFSDLLDDKGVVLNQAKQLSADIKTSSKIGLWWKYRDLFKRINSDLGFYDAKYIQTWLKKQIVKKLPQLKDKQDITFNDLALNNCAPLKIVVSDLAQRLPQVCSNAGGEEINGFVIDAVRASMSYPFVFKPVKHNARYWVDGGLTTNLPLFLFENERKQDGLPLIAFDLVTRPKVHEGEYGLGKYCGDMLSTMLEAGDYMQQRFLNGVYHIRIPVPEGIGTLDFGLKQKDCEALFNAGALATHEFFAKVLSHWSQAKTSIARLQALHAPPSLVAPILRSLIRELESGTSATKIRASVMLATERQTRIVVYHQGFDGDPDSDLELALDGGGSGLTWKTRKPIFVDLDQAKQDFAKWNMTVEQQSKVKPDRKAMISLPIFDVSKSAQGMGDLDILGVLCVDTDTKLDDTQWKTDKSVFVMETLKAWADVLAKVIR